MPSARAGLSVVEVIVALMLVTIALLGMAGSTALALRQVTDAAVRRAATDRAVSRMAVLASQGCVRASSGAISDSTRGVRERWVVSGSPGFARVSDTITWTSPRGPRTWTLDSAFPC